MSKVYIVHDGGRIDWSDARRYGEPVVIFTKDVYPDNADEQMPFIMGRAKEALKDFGRNDYLCLVGSPLYMAVCSYVLGEKVRSLGPVRVLRFDKIEQAYYTVRLA